MIWSKNLDKNFRLQREPEKKQEEEQKPQIQKKQNTFYGDYKSRQQKTSQSPQGNTLQRAVSENPFTPVKTKVFKSYQDRKKEGSVFFPNTRLTSGDDAIAIEMPSKSKMYLNDAATGLQNAYLSILQTADILRPAHYLKEAAKKYTDYTGNDKYEKAGDIIAGAVDPLGKGISDLKNLYEKYARAGEQMAAEMHYMTPGTTDDYIGMGVKTVAGMVPQMLAAAATGGASSGEQIADYGTKTIGNIIYDKIISNPSFWYGFAQNAGPSFEKAKDKGASDAMAFSAGIQNGIFNGITEAGGGVESFKPVFSKIALKSAAEDGVENVFQGAGERFIEKSIYDYDKPWFSKTDEDAVINPKRAGGEFTSGMLMNLARQLGHMGLNESKRIYNDYKEERPVFRMRENNTALENGIKKMYNYSANESRTSSLQEQFPYKYRGKREFIPNGSDVNSINVNAGKGSDVPIYAEDRLIEQFGGNTGEWQKCAGQVKSAKYMFDMYWFELNGQQYKMKIKHMKELK